MSRTYRTIDHRRWDDLHCDYVTEYEWVHNGYAWNQGDRVKFSYFGIKRVQIEPTKKDFALARRDGANWYASVGTYYYKKIHRVNRAYEHRNNVKAVKALDYDDIDYDMSGADAHRKGIMWQIY